MAKKENASQGIVEAEALTVKSWLDKGMAMLVDVRETSEYEQEHIPGSMLVPLSVFDPDLFPRISGKKLVIHCAVGKRSAAAIKQLLKAGYEPPAINLEGGIKAWKDAGLTTEIQDIPPPRPQELPYLSDDATAAGEAAAVDVATAHPGHVLEEEYLKPLHLSQSQVAGDIGLPASSIGEIISGARPVDAESAFRLARYFSTSEEFWMRLQMAYDLAKARQELGQRIHREVMPRKTTA
ncbi:MAG TPA: HigA family addiction module antitoxin [Rhodospirillales bacterium]|jgi:addiction module HigA family antidote|nr:HigA family addiction module antitoxin [Rhodospirillales bacterium]